MPPVTDDRASADPYAALRRRAPDAPADAGELDGFHHPGYQWLNDAACCQLELEEFFAKAGHVLSDAAKEACMSCPVWRECTVFAYLGNPDGKLVTGGYFAMLSPGQRKKMTLREALEWGERVRAEAAEAAQEAAERNQQVADPELDLGLDATPTARD